MVWNCERGRETGIVDRGARRESASGAVTRDGNIPPPPLRTDIAHAFVSLLAHIRAHEPAPTAHRRLSPPRHTPVDSTMVEDSPTAHRRLSLPRHTASR